MQSVVNLFFRKLASVECKKHSRKKDEKYTKTLDDKIIEEKNNVKYLGVILDQFLTFQDKIKRILRHAE